MNNIDDGIQLAAIKVAGTKVEWEGFHRLADTALGREIWNGVVQQYASKSGRVYAWAVKNEREMEFFAVFCGRPIDTPAKAVQAWHIERKAKSGSS